MAQSPADLAEAVRQEPRQLRVGLRRVGQIAITEQERGTLHGVQFLLEPRDLGGALSVALPGQGGVLVDRISAEAVGREVDYKDMEPDAVDSQDRVQGVVERRQGKPLRAL